MSRSPQGERGLKQWVDPGIDWDDGRSPQGERGLKLIAEKGAEVRAQVAPRKGSVG